VNIPLIGLVRAEGLTPRALEEDIAHRLKAADILRAPQVNVLVSEYRSRVVAVVGSVEKPGLYPLTRPKATLADLIWAAGGPGKDAGREVKFVPAADGAHPDGMARSGPMRPIRVDLETLLGATQEEEAKALNPQVRPGDSISVSPAGNVQVDGWVDKPGSYPVTRGLTLTGAVAAAGGHLFPADRHHVTVKRFLGPGEQRYFTVDLDAVSQGRAADVPITDGDVVRLPPKPTRVVAWGFWSFAKEIVHIYGSVPVF
jgi:polysaccharide export outer membrane protein